ncbi:MAG: helix-turn-helix domain-containing protein [Deltaproteobacteria bacterium]|nr:helix-turn-helix domain-containing protein [Deltaproteobacteria bacterium]
MKKYGAPSVKKAFAILSAISSSKNGLGVSELAKKLKMAKSTVHGWQRNSKWPRARSMA